MRGSKAALIALIALAWPLPSAAQEDVPAACLIRGSRACLPTAQLPIPANGAILIAANEGSAIEVTVWNEQLTARKSGSLAMIAEGMWAWTPTDGFLLGSYSVEVEEDSIVQDSALITVVDATERDWPELMSAASLSQVIGNGPPSCCTLDTGGGVIDFACASLSETTYAVLHPGLSSASSPIDLNQYLFRYTVAGDSAQATVLPWSMMAELPIYEGSDEYCYEIEAIDLVTGEAHSYAELEGRCVEHGTLAPLGDEILELADDALASTLCPMPPNELKDRWCAVNAEACEIETPPRKCHFYPFTCHDADYPGPGWQSSSDRPWQPLTGLIDRVDAINERTGDEEPSDAGASSEQKERHSTAGCTILRQHTQATLSHLIFGIIAIFALRRGRRDRR